jgi:hypothetical protein
MKYTIVKLVSVAVAFGTRLCISKCAPEILVAGIMDRLMEKSELSG